MFYKERLIKQLNSRVGLAKRLSLKGLLKAQKHHPELIPSTKNVVPLHYFSTYYYSLYSPYLCAYDAYRCGSYAVGINDYATLNFCAEFKEACDVLKMPYVMGYHIECTPLLKEEKTVLYAYGIPHKYCKEIDCELKPLREEKLKTVTALINIINEELSCYDIEIRLKDVLKISKYKKGGTVTEKHVAKVLAENILDKFNKKNGVVNFVKSVLLIRLSENDELFIGNKSNDYQVEYLTKLLYNEYCVKKTKKFLVDYSTYLKLNASYGIISSYRIDVNNYSDSELLKALDLLKRYGFNGISFKCETLEKDRLNFILNSLIKRQMLAFDLTRLGIPGEVVKIREENPILYKFAMSLIGNAISVSYSVDDGFYGKNTVKKCEDFETRLELFTNVGKRGY